MKNLIEELFSTFVLVALACGVLAFGLFTPAHAQGSGAGTLPVIRQTGVLSNGQLAIVYGAPSSSVDLAIGSTQNSREEILREYQAATGHGPAGEHDAQCLVTPWVSHGHVIEVRTPRWANESGSDGARRWAKRHAEAVEALHEAFPEDPKTGGG